MNRALEGHPAPVRTEARSRKSLLLDPLRTGPGGTFRRAAFDEPSDQPVDAPEEAVDPAMVLVFDGVFSHRPELREHWDLSVLLEAEGRVEAEWNRCLPEDRPGPGPAGDAEVERRWTVS